MGRLSRICIFYINASFDKEVNWQLTVIALCGHKALDMIVWPMDLMQLLPGHSLAQGRIKIMKRSNQRWLEESLFQHDLEEIRQGGLVKVACVILLWVDSHKCEARPVSNANGRKPPLLPKPRHSLRRHNPGEALLTTCSLFLNPVTLLKEHYKQFYDIMRSGSTEAY